MIGDFAQCPTLQEAFDLASGCHWSDPLLQLECWTQLSSLALKQQDYHLVCDSNSFTYSNVPMLYSQVSKCCDKGLEFVNTSEESNVFIKVKLSK